MTSTFGNNLYESQRITKPSFFNGDNYPYWKNRMILFIKSNDYQVWDVVEYDPFIPIKRKCDRMIPKVKVKMTDEERRRMQGLGEVIPEDKLVRKLLYSLPESWDSKRTAIIEAKDLKALKLDALMSFLLTHEIMKQGKEEEKKKGREEVGEEVGEEGGREEEDRNCSQSVGCVAIDQIHNESEDLMVE
ncbi:hypothetical protein GQ457_02G043230 [Hibiscus cannabinus]